MGKVAFDSCCMCGENTLVNELVERLNGDVFCKKCDESHCEHQRHGIDTHDIPGTFESYSVCTMCGSEV